MQLLHCNQQAAMFAPTASPWTTKIHNVWYPSGHTLQQQIQQSYELVRIQMSNDFVTDQSCQAHKAVKHSRMW
jgi:hypothetical protein